MVVVVECPNCHRPLAELTMAGGRVAVGGRTYAENGDPGGVLTVGGPKRNWGARVYSSDPLQAPGTASGVGRRTFVCNGKRCHRPNRGPFRHAVTESALTAGYLRAEGAGRKRISVTELR